MGCGMLLGYLKAFNINSKEKRGDVLHLAIKANLQTEILKLRDLVAKVYIELPPLFLSS